MQSVAWGFKKQLTTDHYRSVDWLHHHMINQSPYSERQTSKNVFKFGGSSGIRPSVQAAVVVPLPVYYVNETQKRETSASSCSWRNVSASGQTMQLEVWCRCRDVPGKVWENVFEIFFILIIIIFRNTNIYVLKSSTCCTFFGQVSFIGSENVFIFSFNPSGWNWGNILKSE